MLKTRKSADCYEINQLIGSRLRAFRAEQGISQQQLAEVLDISLPQIQKYEKGKTRLRLDMIDEIAHCFTLRPCALVQFLTEPHVNHVEKDPFSTRPPSSTNDNTHDILEMYNQIKSPELRRQARDFLKELSRHEA